MINVLFIGDVVAAPGRFAVRNLLPQLKAEFSLDFIIANGENLAGGIGITEKTALDLRGAGVDVLTGGNHIWDKWEGIPFVDSTDWVIRPLNYPPGTPGRGFNIFQVRDASIMVVNLIGRVFMNGFDCPFRAIEELLSRVQYPNIVIVDFHAEATSEKVGMGYYLDGRVSLVVGTHTHVQTSDARVLPKGTGYITDVGMTGGLGGIIGVKKELFIKRLISQMPVGFEPAEEEVGLEGVVARIDEKSGKCLEIFALRRFVENYKDGI